MPLPKICPPLGAGRTLSLTTLGLEVVLTRLFGSPSDETSEHLLLVPIQVSWRTAALSATPLASCLISAWNDISPKFRGFTELLTSSLDGCIAALAVGVLTLRSLSTRRVGVEDAIVPGQGETQGCSSL